MSSIVSTDGARRVMPAHAGIQAVPLVWIPAYAGMTLSLYMHAHAGACDMHNTL